MLNFDGDVDVNAKADVKYEQSWSVDRSLRSIHIKRLPLCRRNVDGRHLWSLWRAVWQAEWVAYPFLSCRRNVLRSRSVWTDLKTFKVRSHGMTAAAIFLPQQPESVHTVRLQLSYIFK